MRYKLLGYPLKFSLSKRIHEYFARQFGLHVEYGIEPVPSAMLTQNIHAFVNAGGKGLNITCPHKDMVLDILDQLLPCAAKALAVNTIKIQDKKLIGANTDGIGFARDLLLRKIELRNKKILILGAGGAVRGIMPVLQTLQPASVCIVNRSLEKAAFIAEKYPTIVQYAAISDLANIRADFILHAINANSDARQWYSQIKFVDAICYDLNYADNALEFLQFAKEHGAKQTIDGLGMLIEQAAEAFYLWHEKRPDTREIRVQLQLDPTHKN